MAGGYTHSGMMEGMSAGTSPSSRSSRGVSELEHGEASSAFQLTGRRSSLLQRRSGILLLHTLTPTEGYMNPHHHTLENKETTLYKNSKMKINNTIIRYHNTKVGNLCWSLLGRGVKDEKGITT